MSTLSTLFLLNLALLGGLILFAWLLSLVLRDASIMDVFWGVSFVVVAWSDLLVAGRTSPRAWLVVALTTIWGLRLAGYLAWRKFGQPEDHRYRAFREQFGRHFWLLSLFVVFILQGILIWVVSWPLPWAMIGTAPLGLLDVVGAGVWAIGFAFEAIGDFQLQRFKATAANRGQVMDQGLWRYTRHPNYFGDFLLWWGLFIIAVGGGAPWWVIVSPLVMSVLLMRVSGVSLIERSLAQSKAGYQEYVTRTSPFFPWPPRG